MDLTAYACECSNLWCALELYLDEATLDHIDEIPLDGVRFTELRHPNCITCGSDEVVLEQTDRYKLVGVR